MTKFNDSILQTKALAFVNNDTPCHGKRQLYPSNLTKKLLGGDCMDLSLDPQSKIYQDRSWYLVKKEDRTRILELLKAQILILSHF
jgi:hypothetical protein